MDSRDHTQLISLGDLILTIEPSQLALSLDSSAPSFLSISILVFLYSDSVCFCFSLISPGFYGKFSITLPIYIEILLSFFFIE